MATVLCAICNAEPKKYKCPTCSTPYCSLACFQAHKPVHASTSSSAPPTSQPTLELPEPPPPAPIPRYLKQKMDFSALASNPQFQELLKTHPSLLASLQRVYAATIEPDPDDRPRGSFRGAYRGRGRGRGWDRGRGRGGRFGGDDRPPRWTPKKGDADATKMLKALREGERGDEEKETMAEFVKLVQEMFGKTQEDGTPA